MYVPKHQPDFISAHKITRSLLNEGYLIIHSAKAIITPLQALPCRSSFLYGHTPINHMAIWEEIQRQLQSNSTYKVTISLRNTATNTPFYIEEQGFSDPKNPTILRGFWRMLSPSSVPAEVFKSVIEQHPLPAAIFNCAGEILYANAQLKQTTGNLSTNQLFQTLFANTVERIAWPDFNETTHWQCTFKTHANQWLRLTVSALKPQSALLLMAVIEDVSAYFHTIQRLEKQAFTDSVTGLPNRGHLVFLVEQFLAQQPNTHLSVLLIDIDNYKRLSDRVSSNSLNELLQEVATRIERSLINSSHWTSRDNLDEFVIVLSNHSQEQSLAVTQELLKCLSRAFLVEKQLFSLTFSIGISYSSLTTDSSLASLLNKAALALRQAKLQGKNRLEIYSPSMKQQSMTTKAIEAGLPHAISLDELDLFLQPKISLEDHSLSGFECLIRWFHPVLGEVTPDRFISLAEENGFINSLGFWVINQACHIGKQWLEEGGISVPIAVNVSPKQLADPTFAEHVEQILLKQEWPAHLLELEVTESLLMEATDIALDQLKALRALGIRLSMDDFGTGYSSLASLRLLPINVLKIDRQFVQNLHKKDQADIQIISAIIGMAHSLNLQVVAEGIELIEQAEILCELGCDIGQGFLYARPMPSSQLQAWFTQYTTEKGVCHGSSLTNSYS